jgi:hypothetical protein
MVSRSSWRDEGWWNASVLVLVLISTSDASEMNRGFFGVVRDGWNASVLISTLDASEMNRGFFGVVRDGWNASVLISTLDASEMNRGFFGVVRDGWNASVLISTLDASEINRGFFGVVKRWVECRGVVLVLISTLDASEINRGFFGVVKRWVECLSPGPGPGPGPDLNLRCQRNKPRLLRRRKRDGWDGLGWPQIQLPWCCCVALGWDGGVRGESTSVVGRLQWRQELRSWPRADARRVELLEAGRCPTSTLHHHHSTTALSSLRVISFVKFLKL